MATASKPCPAPMCRDWWSDGSTDVVYEPQDFMAKLAALVPAPRVHLTRFHGVLAPGAKWRSWIVPKPSVELDVSSAAVPIPLPESAPGINDPAEANGSTKEMLPRRNYAWAYLMMRVFLLDVLQCERCGGRVKILAAIHPPTTTRKILDCLGLPSRGPPWRPLSPISPPIWTRSNRCRNNAAASVCFLYAESCIESSALPPVPKVLP